LLEAIKYVNLALKNNIELTTSVVLYLTMNLGIYIQDKSNCIHTYQNYQFLDYDEYVAIEHIISTHKSDFSKRIDIHLLFNLINKYLVDEYKTPKLSLGDIYVVPFSNCGRKGENFIKVITIPNTKMILSMFPVRKRYQLSEKNMDVNLENEIYLETKKIKQKSK